MSPELDAKIERLKTEASERWGDNWTVRVQHFADADAHAFAFTSRGRNEDGDLVHDRLFLLENGEAAVERVTMERNELDSETLEAPQASA